jgi:hypothetical protein
MGHDAPGPLRLGEAAAAVQFSRSIGAAFGTALATSVLFAVLSIHKSRGGTAVRHHYGARLALSIPLRRI